MAPVALGGIFTLNGKQCACTVAGLSVCHHIGTLVEEMELNELDITLIRCYGFEAGIPAGDRTCGCTRCSLEQ